MAQTSSTVRKIEVMGSAEREVVPDEIYLNIALREYLKDGKARVKIDVLEKELYNTLLKNGVSKDDVHIEDIYGYNWQWGKKKTEEFFARKRYRIKLNNINKINDILTNLDQKGTESVNIGEVTHSKIEEYKLELKANALLAARQKANYLLKAIDEETGRVLEIQEMHEGFVQPIYETRMMDMASSSEDVAQPQIEFKKLKLKYEIKGVFEIK